MSIEDRIPDMSDAELKSLHANAARLADTDSKQQAEAARLLPLIDAEMEARAQSRASELAARRAERREADAAARRAKRSQSSQADPS